MPTLPYSTIAAGLGISKQMVGRLALRGMPTTSIAAARVWREANLEPSRRKEYRMHAPPRPAAALTRAGALGRVADERIAAGQPLGELEAPLRAALHALPDRLRDPLPVSFAVVNALCRAVIDALEAQFSEAERAAEREKLEAGGEAMAREMGAFWYRVAAGELVLAQ